MTADSADSLSLRALADEAERRGLDCRLDDLRRDCREGRLAAVKRSGAWRVPAAEAARWLAGQGPDLMVPLAPGMLRVQKAEGIDWTAA